MAYFLLRLFQFKQLDIPFVNNFYFILAAGKTVPLHSHGKKKKHYV